MQLTGEQLLLELLNYIHDHSCRVLIQSTWKMLEINSCSKTQLPGWFEIISIAVFRGAEHQSTRHGPIEIMVEKTWWVQQQSAVGDVSTITTVNKIRMSCLLFRGIIKNIFLEPFLHLTNFFIRFSSPPPLHSVTLNYSTALLIKSLFSTGDNSKCNLSPSN